MEKFLTYLLYNKWLSENTIIRYRKGLKKFECYLSSVWKTLCRPYEIELSDIFGYITKLREDRLSPATCNNDINAIRGFLRYNRNILNLNVLDPSKVISCKVHERNIWFYNKDQKRLILKSVNRGVWKRELTQLRNKILTYMLLHTGLRCHEIAKIKVEEIWENLQVVGKWWKHRTVYLRPELLEMIEQYLSKRKRESEYLFDSTKAWHHFRESSIRRIYEQLTNTLWFRIHPHKFRHTFCTDLLHIQWANIYNVAKLMGHKRITTTQIYIWCDDLELKKLQFWLKY